MVGGGEQERQFLMQSVKYSENPGKQNPLRYFFAILTIPRCPLVGELCILQMTALLKCFGTQTCECDTSPILSKICRNEIPLCICSLIKSLRFFSVRKKHKLGHQYIHFQSSPLLF